MMRRAQLYVILMAVGMITLVAWVLSSAPRPGGRFPAPEIAIPAQSSGPPVPLSSHKGKVVILDFWATWCVPCRLTIPELEALYTKYHEQGLEIIGISTDSPETRKQVPQAQKDLGMTYPVVFSDDMPTVRQEYPADSLPTMYILDKNGNIADVVVGYRSRDELEPKLLKLLKSRQDIQTTDNTKK